MNHSDRGFSLLELVVALALLGLTIGGIFAVWNASQKQQVVLTQRDLLERAEAGLIAYARFNSRLPCPAADSEGSESCSAGNSKGYFPWKTVGLPEQAARKLRYGVFRNPSDVAMKDADLAVRQDRFKPLETTGSAPVAVETLIGNANGIDLCHSLRIAALDTISTTNTSTLYVANGVNTRNVAFAIALPGVVDADGDGSPFDDLNGSASPAFDSPQKVSGTDYDDAVRTRTFGTLFTDLGCGETLASADHAHFNVSTFAALMRQGMNDYHNQLELIVEAADIAVDAGEASVVSAAAGVASAAAEILSSTAGAIVKPAEAGAVVLAVAASTAAIAGTVLAAIELSEANDNYDEAVDLENDFDGTYHLQTYAQSLDDSILTHAKNADAAGL